MKPTYYIFLGAFLPLLLVGCSDADPNEQITDKNLKKAQATFSETELLKINALGGKSYLLGKTINGVKKRLDNDYSDREISDLISHETTARESNLSQYRQGKLTVDNLHAGADISEAEKNLQIREIGDYFGFLNKVESEKKKTRYQGSVTLAKGSLTCRRLSDLEEVFSAAENSPDAEKRIVNRKIRRKECYLTPKDILLPIRQESTASNGTKIIHTARGWIPKDELKTFPTKEEIEEIAKKREAELDRLKQSPSPAFYSVFRPLLGLSSEDIGRVKLAEKAIKVNMTEYGEDWQNAALRLVKEQDNFARSEYLCVFEKDCQGNYALKKRMAHYILSSNNDGIKAGQIPCKILQRKNCLKVD